MEKNKYKFAHNINRDSVNLSSLISLLKIVEFMSDLAKIIFVFFLAATVVCSVVLFLPISKQDLFMLEKEWTAVLWMHGITWTLFVIIELPIKITISIIKNKITKTWSQYTSRELM